MTTSQIPSLSREVHFIIPNGQHRTAKVINTNPDRPETPTLKVELDPFTDHVTLDSLGEQAMFSTEGLFIQDVPYDETGQTPGTYHWPERV